MNPNGSTASSAAKIRTKLCFLSISAALLALAGCASSPDPLPRREGPPAASFMPLEIGNRWVFRSEVGGEIQENELRIESYEGGFYWDNHGGALRVDGEGIRDQLRYLLLEPLVVGQRWESRLPDGSVERYEIVAVNQVIEVPAGRFEGVLQARGVTSLDEGAKLEVLWSWAPAVGMVRIEPVVVSPAGERIPQPTSTLVSFDFVGEAAD